MKGFLLCLFLWLTPSLLLAGSSVNLIRGSADEVMVKINTGDFEQERKKVGETLYQRITVDGWGRAETAGSPQLPTRGILVGIPSRGTVKVEVIQADAEELSGLNIYPCPQKAVEEKGGEIFLKEVFYRDKEAYSRDSYIPGKLVQVSETGYMRGQKVAKVDICPFQYNPVKKKLRVYRNLLIRVSFEGGEIEPLTFSSAELPYEEMLQKLLVNYGSLGRYEGEARVQRGDIIRAEANGKADLKVHLTGEGIYKIGYSNLSSLWQLGTIDPRKIHLKHLGVEIPIVFQGETDGQFNSSDYLLFYAPPLDSYYTDYTTDDVYWLSVETTDGLRMDSVDGTLSGGQLLTSFSNLYHGEEDHEYWETIPNGGGQDHFFWTKLTPPSTSTLTINFTLNNILSTKENCSLTVAYRGKTDDYAKNPDHHTQAAINGWSEWSEVIATYNSYVNGSVAWSDVIDSYTQYVNQSNKDTWNGQIEYETTVSFSQSYLQNGSNTLTVKSLGDTGATVDTIYFNWFELAYEDTYVAESNTLKFSGTGSGKCEIDVSGFTSADINLFDITDAVNPKNVTNSTIASGTILKFTDTISGSKEYMAVATGGTKTPTSIETDVPSNLKSTSNGADYIVITHEYFYNAIQPLATYRASQGKRVMVVKVGDVYDEFSYGIFDPKAIQDFLKYAYENYQAPAPLYCLLVGDANIDYKDNLATGRKNYVPTHIYQTDELGDTPTDNWFACVSGDDVIPDMYIGRISVQTATEATDVVNKILAYEQGASQAWNQQALFVADNEVSFESADDTLATDYLPSTYQGNKVYLSQYDINQNGTIDTSETQKAKNDLINYINSGQLMTVYVGHGSVDNWAAEYLFTSSDVPSLTNSTKPTFVVTLTCLNGFFASPVDDYCLGETFLNAKDKGAIGCLVPTSLGFTWEHSELAQALFDSIFQDGHKLLGQSTTEAKVSAYQLGVPSDIIQAFVLLGDPYTELKAVNANQ